MGNSKNQYSERLIMNARVGRNNSFHELSNMLLLKIYPWIFSLIPREEIAINLANNALKFTDSGEVTISIKKGETVGDNFEIITEVSDTGRGIPEDKISNLFMPYQQVNRKNDRKYGSGLGLIICKELVKLLGGNIRVQSEIEMGSVFTFNSIFQKFENIENLPDNLTF